MFRSSRLEVFCRKPVLDIFGKFAAKYPSGSSIFLIFKASAFDFSKTGLAFPYESSENFQNIFSIEHQPAAAF